MASGGLGEFSAVVAVGTVPRRPLGGVPRLGRLRFLLFGRACPAVFIGLIAWNQFSNLMHHLSVHLARQSVNHLAAILPEARRLVTRGPYRLVRHPLHRTPRIVPGVW